MASRTQQSRRAAEAVAEAMPDCGETTSSAGPRVHRLHRVPLPLQRVGDEGASGKIVPFPGFVRGRFTAEMRGSLARFASEALNAQPLAFDADSEGAERCLLGNGLVIGWDREHRLIVTDALSGYVDRGPFSSLDEIYALITYLSA